MLNLIFMSMLLLGIVGKADDGGVLPLRHTMIVGYCIVSSLNVT